MSQQKPISRYNERELKLMAHTEFYLNIFVGSRQNRQHQARKTKRLRALARK